MSMQAYAPNSSIEISPEKKELLKKTICKGGTDEDLEVFMHVCNRSGLDPFSRQIYAVFRNDYKTGKNVMSIQTGIDGYRLLAERTGKYMPGKECTFTYDGQGELMTATAYVKKMGPDNQWHEIAHTVHWKEYAAMKDGKPMAMWKDKGHVMLSKCAESGVLRKAFPADMSGLYTKEEMDTVETVHISEPVEIKSVAVDFITEHQSEELEMMVHAEGEQFKADFLKFISNACGHAVGDISKIPAKSYDLAIKAVKKKCASRMKEEMNAATDVKAE